MKTGAAVMLLVMALAQPAYGAESTAPAAEAASPAAESTAAIVGEDTAPADTASQMPADPDGIVTNEIPGWPAAANVEGTTACLMDASTGTVLYDKGAREKMYPASITKVMTCLLALEKGNLADSVTMTQTGVAYAVSGSSNLYTQVGEVFTLEQLLYGTMLKSANDMATQVGEYIGGGSLEAFVQMMNDRAAQLGCVNTHFNNACGMPDPENYSCAYDIALIAREAVRHPDFRKIVGTHSYTIPATNLSGERTVTSHVAMLVDPNYAYPGIIGGKTGYTDAAQSTLVTFASREGLTLVAVSLHGADGAAVVRDCIKLLDYGYDNFHLIRVGEDEYTYDGGWIIAPNGIDESEIRVNETTYEKSGVGEIVQEQYFWHDKQLGYLDMTRPMAEKLREDLAAATAGEKTPDVEKEETDSSAYHVITGSDLVTIMPQAEGSSQGEAVGPLESFTERDRQILMALGGVIGVGIVLIFIILIVQSITRKKRRRR